MWRSPLTLVSCVSWCLVLVAMWFRCKGCDPENGILTHKGMNVRCEVKKHKSQAFWMRVGLTWSPLSTPKHLQRFWRCHQFLETDSKKCQFNLQISARLNHTRLCLEQRCSFRESHVLIFLYVSWLLNLSVSPGNPHDRLASWNYKRLSSFTAQVLCSHGMIPTTVTQVSSQVVPLMPGLPSKRCITPIQSTSQEFFSDSDCLRFGGACSFKDLKD